jgi:transcriptional regulator with XRE-family HTH domain
MTALQLPTRLTSRPMVDWRLANGRGQMTMTGEQLKAARELIGLSQLALAVQFQVGLRTVAEFEAGKQTFSPETLRAVGRALESAGVIFVEEDSDKPAVRLRTATKS